MEAESKDENFQARPCRSAHSKNLDSTLIASASPYSQPSSQTQGHGDAGERSPSTPGHLAPFDWNEFEARYEEALVDADRQEQELLKEFEKLVKFFNVWAYAASVHDTERGVKRLQTRERYLKIAEHRLSQKKKHLSEVVRAFQSALALLSQT
ncbi:hypothetical protein C8A03DRAFT_19753 [Achaetomium macrosporum]|uniref:Uncharacterized protein n=1 Tax=Achaetomium macrosporum TaxID=79813 RepID=A0AAN7C113_9PEZI|nr:hypothetical protein C8A03DRAFT_19753 [Achaetomium macrosporum]